MSTQMYNSITGKWPKRRKVLDFGQDPTDPTGSITSVDPLENSENDVLRLGKPPAMEAASKLTLLPRVNTPSIDFMDDRVNGLIGHIPLDKPSNKPILLDPNNGNKVGGLPQLTMPTFDVDSPAINLKAPLNTPLEMEAPTPIGYRPSLTIDRNASQIEAPANVGGTAKYVRGYEEIPTPRHLDPYEQARLELGAPEKRGVWGVVKDGLKGLAYGGVQGALYNGLEGENIRYQNAFDNRVGEIKDGIELQRRNRLDNDNSAYKQTQIDNIIGDNKRALEALAETKRRNLEREKDLDQRFNQQGEQFNKKLEFEKHKQEVNAYLKMVNQPNLAPEARAQLANQLKDAGINVPSDYDPRRNDQLELKVDADGNTFVVNKTQATSTTVKDPNSDKQLQLTQKQPRVTEADIRSQLYSEYSQKYPDGQMPNPLYHQQKAKLLAQNPEATEEDLERRMARKHKDISKTIPIEKSAEFKTALANGVTKQRGNVGSVGTSTPPGSKGQSAKFEKDLQSATQLLRTNPQMQKQIIEALTADYPDTDIAGELQRRSK